MQSEIGKSYVYSNFGYCLLGRIIEKVTQKSYIDYIRDKFDVDVKVAGGPANKLLPSETYYYSQNQDDCFTMPLSRMDSCAGLIISQKDLVKFANSIPRNNIEQRGSLDGCETLLLK